MSPFTLAPTIEELSRPKPFIPVPISLDEALSLRDEAAKKYDDLMRGNGSTPHDMERIAAEQAQVVLEVSAVAAWEEMVRDKRGELELDCPTWDEGHCGCPKHGAEAACSTWQNGCRCITGHDTKESCNNWAEGCCCDHAADDRRPCNNHINGHSGTPHTQKQGKPWCVVHQGTDCSEACESISLDTFLSRFKN